jgi:hypothetical protein
MHCHENWRIPDHEEIVDVVHFAVVELGRTRVLWGMNVAAACVAMVESQCSARGADADPSVILDMLLKSRSQQNGSDLASTFQVPVTIALVKQSAWEELWGDIDASARSTFIWALRAHLSKSLAQFISRQAQRSSETKKVYCWF